MFAIRRLLRADPQPTFLGMDLGTGSAKTVVTAASGSVVARAKVVTHHPAGARLLGVCATRSVGRETHCVAPAPMTAHQPARTRRYA